MYASGHTDQGHEYMVMERLGPTLRLLQSKVKNKNFSIKTVVQIGLQLLERLETLHSMGYLHMDLKPDNILVTSDYQ